MKVYLFGEASWELLFVIVSPFITGLANDMGFAKP